MYTLVNRITGASTEKDEHLGHEKVGHENEDGGGDHRLGRRLTDSHSPAGRVEAGVASDHADNAGEDGRFDETVNQVVAAQGLKRPRPIKAGGDAQVELSDHEPTEQCDAVGADLMYGAEDHL